MKSHVTGPIALTMGDPAGIGPEIAAAAWASGAVRHPFFLIGDPALIAGPLAAIGDPVEASAAFASALPVLPHRLTRPSTTGVPDPDNAPTVVEIIDRAVRLNMDGRAVAVVTNPISKKVLYDGAGFSFPGHTEYLAHLGGAHRPVMMLAGPQLRVVPVTIHVPLAAVPGLLRSQLIEETAGVLHEALIRDFGIARPRIAVTGLNPHAGEGGAMGREEIDIIIPALDRLRERGMAVTGPHPADTMFHERARAGYDAALTMYHDQGLIPLKALDFDRGVNVTLGLPFVRTSPDHGTAFDIAGKGIASPISLIEALNLAGDMAAARAS